MPHVLLRAALRGLVVLGPVTEAGHAFVPVGRLARRLPAPRTARAAGTRDGRRRPRAAGRPRARGGAGRARAPLPARPRPGRGRGPRRLGRACRWATRAPACERARAGQEARRRDAARGGRSGGRRGPARLAPRLLGAFDPWLLGWRDRAHAVAPEHARRVHPGGGVVRAVATDDGMVVGTWTARRRGGAAEVALEPFAPLGARVARALTARRPTSRGSWATERGRVLPRRRGARGARPARRRAGRARRGTSCGRRCSGAGRPA